MSAAPSGPAPVPQSHMKQAPPLVVTPIHEVLPPKRTVPEPDTEIDPPGCPSIVLAYSLQCQLCIPPWRQMSCRASSAARLLQGCTDFRNPVKAVADAGSLHVVAQDAHVFVIRVVERCCDRIDVLPPVLQKAGN